jgi:hypothetical protein
MEGLLPPGIGKRCATREDLFINVRITAVRKLTVEAADNCLARQGRQLDGACGLATGYQSSRPRSS